jgi:transposase
MERMSRPSRFSPEQRAKAVRLVAEARPNYPSEWAAIESVAAKLGASAETVRKWIRHGEVDAGLRAGVSTEESAEIKKLRREVAELRRANEILKAAAAFFGAELDRPQSRS